MEATNTGSVKVLSRNLITFYVELPSVKRTLFLLSVLNPAIIKETCSLKRSPATIESISSPNETTPLPNLPDPKQVLKAEDESNFLKMQIIMIFYFWMLRLSWRSYCGVAQKKNYII
ncbi:unnamed protein product [Lepeophtheirus salmonis]|uniref:(salmon louse) hypothetical protein n=1 Tax=Lepeophtheirus salmonis TaxID=72036 RepID=A0A7R8GZU1_LEPSM|nr:unnamed protein product [Lepeophtheirus salmonis]CAF2773368.1 unnamed protein product [Lepeophtheirus salmonis]